MSAHRLGFLLFDGCQGLDLFGPLDAFSIAADHVGGHYEWSTIALADGPIRTESGVQILADCQASDRPCVDTLIVPGGRGARECELDKMTADDLRWIAGKAQRVVSICTGAFLLARLGLSEGKTITTHWRFAEEYRRNFPGSRVEAEALFVNDGKIWCSAGITSGIDLSLELIKKDLGGAIAMAVAREMLIYIKRQGDQSQFSQSLAIQGGASKSIANALAWFEDHLSENISVRDLARAAALSERHFARHFEEECHTTPGRYMEQRRLDRAKALLSASSVKIGAVAEAVGFASSDAFSRAFNRRFGLTPSEYRKRFEIN